MKITNKAGLPEPLVRAVQMDQYGHDCDFTTTTLIKPPRIVALERAHKDEIEEDAADRIWSLMGQLGHLVLERAGMGELTERRFKTMCQGKMIGGQVDLWKENTLLDYKFTSIWAATGGCKPEWEQQQNINAFLCHEHGVIVEKAQIVCIFRDWSKMEASRNHAYPQQQVRVLDVPLWSVERQWVYLMLRVQAHIKAMVNLPECTPLERWAKPDKFALMAPNRKRAVIVLDTLKEAKSMVDTGAGHYIEHRPGINTRCESYCQAAPFCDFFKKIKENENLNHRASATQEPLQIPETQ